MTDGDRLKVGSAIGGDFGDQLPCLPLPNLDHVFS